MLRGNERRNPFLQAAWNKYGESAFGFFVIELCPIDKLIERESFWLKEMRATDRKFGFNIFDASGLSEKVRSDLSFGRKGKKLSAAHRAAISSGRKGIKFSTAHCEAIRRAKVGSKYPPRSPESKLRSSIGIAAWHHRNGRLGKTAFISGQMK